MVDQFNPIVDDLVASNNLIAGPDFYAFLLANPDDFHLPAVRQPRDRRLADPDDTGLQMMNQLWATAAHAA